MPMTLTEKILARHAGRESVAPGDNIWVDVDVLMTHDVCGPGTIGVFHQHFGRARAGVVVGCLSESIGAGRCDSEVIAGIRRRHAAIAREEIAGLADRPHNVRHDLGRCSRLERKNFVMRFVERRTNQIVHCGIDNDKFFRWTLLPVQHAG